MWWPMGCMPAAAAAALPEEDIMEESGPICSRSAQHIVELGGDPSTKIVVGTVRTLEHT